MKSIGFYSVLDQEWAPSEARAGRATAGPTGGRKYPKTRKALVFLAFWSISGSPASPPARLENFTGEILFKFFFKFLFRKLFQLQKRLQNFLKVIAGTRKSPKIIKKQW